MKKKTLITTVATFAIAALAFSGLTTNSTSINELRSKATEACVPSPNEVCIYGEYVMVGYMLESW